MRRECSSSSHRAAVQVRFGTLHCPLHGLPLDSAFPRHSLSEEAAVNHRLLTILCVSAGLLAGCAEYKEYRYRDFTVSREQAYDAVRYVLDTEGYEVVTYEENWVNDLPESYLETSWNMRQTGNPYPGNDVRRMAYIKITTRYSDRKPVEYQPLT